MLTQELIRIGNNSDGILNVDSIVIRSTVTCYGEVYGKFTFPDALVRQTVYSVEKCDEWTVNYELQKASRSCTGDGFSAAEWDEPVEADCGMNATTEQLLERLTMVNVTIENVKEVSNDVEDITTEADMISVEALQSTAEILEDILNTDSDSIEVTNSVVQVVNNLFIAEEAILMQSQLEDQAPTKIVEVLEDQLSLVELDDDNVYNEVTPNLAVQAQKVNVSQASQEELIYFTFISESSANGVGVVQGIDDNVKIPDPANVSIAVPTGISDVIKEKNMTDFRIVVIVYNDSRLFQSAQFVNDSSGRRPNSQVISLSVPELDRFELDEPIVITFIPLEISDTNENTTCVFWDYRLDGGIGGWSPEGCTFVNGSADGSDRQYCECNHLTSFAILMDFYQREPPPPASTVVTIVGLSISIASLCLTVFTFLSNKKFRKSVPKQILCQLCLSLLGLYIVFLAGIDRTESNTGCIVAGALLHYFLLSSIFWMSVQAVNMYILFVKVFNTHIPHLFIRACLFAWGLPVPIVMVSVLIDIDTYVDSINNCFLTLQRLYYAVAVPVAISLLFNVIVFIMVLNNLSQLKKNTSKVSSKAKKNRTKGMQMLHNVVSITTVLGLTWLIGFFAIGDASEIMLWLFCILNSFQGFIIFIMYCVRNKEVRTHWREMIHNAPINSKRIRYYLSGKNQANSELVRTPSTKRRSLSNSHSFSSKHSRSDSSEVKLGRHSYTSENVILRG
ncbi:adhesion G-protein coupled receptor G2-like [Anneissia japonica]|uniref:adhesion G-protein coupled receptor G2-like n=1 Tax=Anneissia japonica TaxID=1529436 RepID=UPI001425527D|nr:adhesion G-protein coupled receptor G2-like [Anneissia japonica]